MNKPSRKVYSYFEPLSTLSMWQFHLLLRLQLNGCKSILDIGCGGGSPIKYINFERAVGVDLDPEYIAKAKKNQTHHEYYLHDVCNIDSLFTAKEFDACISLDVIEHLKKPDGLKLIDTMKKLAKKKVILFTPNGYMHQADKNHPLQDHQSGWTTNEMKKMGFKVYGMLGPKNLRTDQHVLKGNKYLTGIVSEIAQLFYISYVPEKSAALFCVMDL